MHPKIIVIGGGFTGLAAAYEFSKHGIPVTIFESDADLGGLGGVFEVAPGVKLEKFYHHWFTSDKDILTLIDELGLSAKIKSNPSNTGLYYANSSFRLSSPWDLLGFKPLPFLDRVRTGIMALVARSIRDWKILENQSAEEWLIRWGGRRAYNIIWDPLLRGKFGEEAKNVSAVWFWNKLKLRGGSRDNQGRESLLYFEGSFGGLIEKLHEYLVSRGVSFRLGEKVEEVIVREGEVAGVRSVNGVTEARIVLATVPLPVFFDITPGLPEDYKVKYRKIRFLGNVCLILRLKESLSKTYWLNVADPTFPFVGVIEHTNFDKPQGLGREHIAYISKYLSTSHHLYTDTDEAVYKFCEPYIAKMFPKFLPSWVLDYKVWRAPYSQPIITKEYSKFVPPYKTPVKGLWLSTMAQVYPEDRGTNYAVREGRRVVREILM